jgi:PadR family transcriptional regulator PadR
MMDAGFGSLETEMNRGFLQILVLVVLERKMYGYGMIKHLDEMGYAVDESTRYRLRDRVRRHDRRARRRMVARARRERRQYRVPPLGKARGLLGSLFRHAGKGQGRARGRRHNDPIPAEGRAPHRGNKILGERVVTRREVPLKK